MSGWILRGPRVALTAVGLAMVVAFTASAGLAQEQVEGAVKVVDADIVMVGKQRVILWAVDAPERSQKCYIGQKEWGCYAESRTALEGLIASGQASCVLKEGKPDPFGRRYGVCTVDGKDIGAEMVRLGKARAFLEQGDDYLALEEAAKVEQVGIFQPGGIIDDPWVWRMRNPGGFR